MFFVISLILGNQTSDKEKAVDEWQNLEVPIIAQPVDSDVPVIEQSLPASTESDIPTIEEIKEDVTEEVPNT